jgi:hypothetical protein
MLKDTRGISPVTAKIHFGVHFDEAETPINRRDPSIEILANLRGITMQ